MVLFAVFGHPIEHSLSPQIHQAFAAQQQRPLTYQRRCPPLDGFATAIQAFRQEGGAGANVTIPFKTEAYTLAQCLTDSAKAAMAVNTLYWQEDLLWGDNTDGIGLIRDITELHQVPLAQQRILLLGAGGAARGIILPLLEQQPASVTIANRTFAKAQQLAAQFNLTAIEIEAIKAEFDVIINASASSLHAQTIPISNTVFKTAKLTYDLMYAKAPTAFLQQAQQAGCHQTIDGLGMLVAQAAASYQRWHAFAPDIYPVVKQLRQQLARP